MFKTRENCEEGFMQHVVFKKEYIQYNNENEAMHSKSEHIYDKEEEPYTHTHIHIFDII